jgi:hypothetical protein
MEVIAIYCEKQTTHRNTICVKLQVLQHVTHMNPYWRVRNTLLIFTNTKNCNQNCVKCYLLFLRDRHLSSTSRLQFSKRQFNINTVHVLK